MYGFTLQLKMSFDASIAKVTEALKQHGFGVLANIDVKATLKAKLNIKRPPYRILGACNRPLSPRAIEADSDIGPLLPYNVVLREEADGAINGCVHGSRGRIAVGGQTRGAHALGTEVRPFLQQVCASPTT